jgi:hypothetical protein
MLADHHGFHYQRKRKVGRASCSPLPARPLLLNSGACLCRFRQPSSPNSSNGYPADPLEQGDWLLLRSPWTRHELLAPCDGSAFVVATRSSGVATEAAREFATWSGVLPPSAVRAFSVVGSAALHALIDRLYRLALCFILRNKSRACHTKRRPSGLPSSGSVRMFFVSASSIIGVGGARSPGSTS